MDVRFVFNVSAFQSGAKGQCIPPTGWETIQENLTNMSVMSVLIGSFWTPSEVPIEVVLGSVWGPNWS